MKKFVQFSLVILFSLVHLKIFPENDFYSKLTYLERKYIKKLRSTGFYVATRKKETVFAVKESGRISGFHYHLIRDFTKFLKLRLKISLVHFSQYFSKNGVVPKKVKTKRNFYYTPDLIKKVHLYMDTITKLPWRSKLLRILTINPVKQVVITRKGMGFIRYSQLKNKRISIQPHSSYATYLKKIENKKKLKFNYVFVEETKQMPVYVNQNKADLTVQDSDLALKVIQKYPNLTIAIPISKVQYTGWAVKKNNKILFSILKKYIRYTKKTGQFFYYFKKEFQMSYFDYLKIIGM